MTKLEIIRANKKAYAEMVQKIETMDGLEKAVAENLILEWIKGNKWMGGLSDSKYQKIADKMVASGYDLMDIMDEFDRQTMEFFRSLEIER